MLSAALRRLFLASCVIRTLSSLGPLTLLKLLGRMRGLVTLTLQRERHLHLVLPSHSARFVAQVRKIPRKWNPNVDQAKDFTLFRNLVEAYSSMLSYWLLRLG